MVKFNKKALVIGIDNYIPRSATQLSTCINDADDMCKILRSARFSVLCRKDLYLNELKLAATDFVRSIQKDDIALFYYSGHGCEYLGHVYVASKDLRGAYWGDIPKLGLDVQDLLVKIHKRQPKLVIMILDCCRTEPLLNPISDRLMRDGSGPGSEMIQRITTPPSTVIAYATKSGSVAVALRSARNSLYTRHLLRYITQPNLNIEKVFINTAGSLKQDPDNTRQQIPVILSSCNKPISIVSGLEQTDTSKEKKSSRKCVFV